MDLCLLSLYAHYTHVIPVHDFLWVKRWYLSLMMGPFAVRGYPSGRHELLFPPRSGSTWVEHKWRRLKKPLLQLSFFLFRSVPLKVVLLFIGFTFLLFRLVSCRVCSRRGRGTPSSLFQEVLGFQLRITLCLSYYWHR
jgi:hypothetical protein